MSDVGKVWEGPDYGDYSEPDYWVRKKLLGAHVERDACGEVTSFTYVWEVLERTECQVQPGQQGRWVDDV